MTTFLGKDRKGRPFSTISAAEWNARYPVGTPVVFSHTVPCPDPEKFGSITRSEAWELGHGEPVVMIEGKSGGKALWALEVVGAAPKTARAKCDHEWPDQVGGIPSEETYCMKCGMSLMTHAMKECP